MLRLVNFGSAKGGLATVGYTIYGVAGNVVTARSTKTVVEIGTSTGIYVADILMPGFDCVILWDTGEGSPRYATENYRSDIDAISEQGVQVNKIYNSIKNQGEFFALFFDKLGLIEKNVGLQKVNENVEKLISRDTVTLTNMEEAFARSARNIQLTVQAPDQTGDDYKKQFDGITQALSALENKIASVAGKDYTGSFSNLMSMLKNTQRALESDYTQKTVALAKEITSVRAAVSKFDELIGMIKDLHATAQKAADKKEIVDAIASVNSFIRRLSATQQDMGILQAFGHKR